MSSTGLYVHLPYCDTKCGYCDFYSVALKGRATGPLVSRVARELQIRTNDEAMAISTVFVGGGTPTVLPFDQFSSFMTSLGDVVNRNPVVEFTVEANPATLDDDKLSAMCGAGVNRLSMGAQSWHPEDLAVLERLHSPDDIAPSVAMARRHNIGNINLDLIFGIPGQTIARWRDSLQRTIDLGVEHIACYGLTYEPGTRLTAQRDAGHMVPCDEDLEAEMFLLAIETLSANGYDQYEISNFAQAGSKCLHNLNYWRNGDYIGVGPSASGAIHSRRYKNVADISRYIEHMDRDGSAILLEETLTPSILAGEFLLMQLRLREGLNLKAFENATHLDAHHALTPKLDELLVQGLLVKNEDCIALSRDGMLVADWVIAELYAALEVVIGAAASTETVNSR